MNRLIWSQLDEAARSAALTRPVQTVAQQTRGAVAALIAQVRTQGDAALRAITGPPRVLSTITSTSASPAYARIR